jgi:hypothetical protein
MKNRTAWPSLLLSIGLAAVLIGLVQFIVLAAPDNPTLDPAPNTHTAPPTTTISITYAESISAATVTSRTVAVQGMQSGLVTAAHTVSGSVIHVDPVGAFYPGELVQTSATTGTLNLAGEEPLAPTVWQFRTAVGGGTGRFGPAMHATFGPGYSRAVALGDLDGDGDLDAVVASDGAAARVWSNEGDGTYSSYTIFGSNKNWDVALGDVDGDGDLDILLAYRYAAPQEVWFNDGSGTFPISTTFGSGDSRGAALGDLDGDGDLDAAVVNKGQPHVAFLNDGIGSYPISTTFGGGDSHDVALGDVDTDGDLDVVVANGSEQAQEVWLNDGSGTFPISTTFGAGRTQDVALGDLDGDGDLDAVLASNGGDPQEAWFNDGSGTFPVSTTFGAGTSRGIALGDVDADGDLDAVVANYYEAQDVWFNDGGGTFPISTTFGANPSWDVALGDVDGDGDLDAVTANDHTFHQEVWLNGDRFYVDADATGAGDGSSWDDAYPYLQDALDAANGLSGTVLCEIWVAEGTYYPDEDGDGDHVNNAVTETFGLRYDGIQLYGGFAGGELELDARDPAVHLTVLSGDVDGNDITDQGVVTTADDIQGDNAYHVLWIDGTNESIGDTTVIDGVTITAGEADGATRHDSGGGLYCYAPGGKTCSPMLANVAFSGNHADLHGGGMFNYGWYGTSSPTLMDVTFSGNRAYDGGGMFNYGWESGASSPTLRDVTFSSNEANRHGGGMANYAGGLSINSTSSPVLINVTFSGNQAGNSAGGMYNYGSSSETSSGTSSPVLTNVTFSGNHGGNFGGAMANEADSSGICSPMLTNVILWGNSATTGTVMVNYAATPTISYSLVEGGWDGSGIYNDDGGIVIDGGNNIDADPQFVAPITATMAPTTTGDYHLLNTSPAIDAGNTLSVSLTTDRDGYVRVRDGDTDGTATVDMGAYEFQRIYVDADGGATRSAAEGSSWLDPHLYLQDALDEVNGLGGAVCEIWVAEGVYYPDLDANGDHAAGVVSETFALSSDGIQLYGGFDPQSGADQWSERDWESYPTVLSGDIDGNDPVDAHGVVTDAEQITGTNAYHVVWVDGVSEPISTTTVVDGFTITGGYGVGSGTETGGGLYCDGSDGGECSPTLSYLTFSGNAAILGGGMANVGALGGKSNPALTDVLFSGNRAEIGGGMTNGGFEGGTSSPTLVNVIFRGNRATVGGGMVNYGSFGGTSSPTMTNVLFSGNGAWMGGGMANLANTANLGTTVRPLLMNVTFSGNQADEYGGAMYNQGEVLGFESNCTPGLANVILWGNAALSGTVMYNDEAEAFVVYSLIEGGCGGSGITNVNGGDAFCMETIINADPAFMRDPDPGDGDWFTLGDNDYGDLRLGPTSPAIDAGDNDALVELVPHVVTDLAGNPRFVDVPTVVDTGDGPPPIVDMGAYEMRWDPVYLPLILKGS